MDPLASHLARAQGCAVANPEYHWSWKVVVWYGPRVAKTQLRFLSQSEKVDRSTEHPMNSQNKMWCILWGCGAMLQNLNILLHSTYLSEPRIALIFKWLLAKCVSKFTASGHVQAPSDALQVTSDGSKWLFWRSCRMATATCHRRVFVAALIAALQLTKSTSVSLESCKAHCQA